jgi:hypothetical protein
MIFVPRGIRLSRKMPDSIGRNFAFRADRSDPSLLLDRPRPDKDADGRLVLTDGAPAALEIANSGRGRSGKGSAGRAWKSTKAKAVLRAASEG